MQLFQNHEKLLTELAKSFSMINSALPRVQIQIELYDVDLMRREVDALFAALIQCLHEMLKFYEEGKWKHAWKSFVGPLGLRFEEQLQNIKICSASVTDLAAALSQLEQRTIRQTQ